MGAFCPGLMSVAVPEEGGGEPEWLPDGAVIYSDFVNGHYYGGGAEVAVTALYGDDPEWGTGFNPATQIVVDGLKGISGQQPAFLGTLLAAVTNPAGFTAKLVFKPVDFDVGDPRGAQFGLADDGFNIEVVGDFYYNGNSDITANNAFLSCDAFTPGVSQTVVFSVGPTRWSTSVNGGSVDTTTPDPIDDVGTWITAGFNIQEGGVRITSFTVFALKPDVDLPAT